MLIVARVPRRFAGYPVEVALSVKTGAAPQRLAHGLVVARAVQSLLGAVIETGDSRQGVQAGQSQRYLVVKLRGIRRIDVANAFLHVMIVEEGNEVTGGVAVRAEHVASTFLRF